MSCSSKEPRTLQPRRILVEHGEVKAHEILADRVREEKALKLSKNPVEFFREIVELARLFRAKQTR
jgi:hypothetical protein